jgi:hypothetical protein
MTKFQLNYFKPKKVDLEDLAKDSEEQNTFLIDGFQSYQPLYTEFFELSESNYNSISFNHRYHITGLTTIWDSKLSQEKDAELFIKFAPLLDPVRYLIGRYKTTDNLTVLPSYKEETLCHEKLVRKDNASYIDNFFCYLSSQLLNEHGVLHGIDYYGSFLGVQKKFRMNLADDIEYLNQSEYFNSNRNIKYEVDPIENPFANFGSRNNKNKLVIHTASESSCVSLEVDELEPVLDSVCEPIEDIVIEEEDCIYEKESVVSSENTSNNSEVNYSSDEEDDEEEEDEDDDEDGEDDDETEEEDEETEEDDEDDEDTKDETEEEDDDTKEDEEDEDEDEDDESEMPLNAYIYDFPVQMICLEKCKGTLDKLFVKKALDIETAASALFQVILTLFAYQRAFQFTHNDLHTNNIMYIDTTEEDLYYKAVGKFFKVPTYGKIFKLIDFGRAIYKFQGRIFCSDSFAPGGDASTQYNCEPFFNEKKPRLEPNMSFDICRLGCSIYDFILDIDEQQDPDSDLDILQKTIIDWVSDDNGKNVLYKSNGEERYPNFKLYKMIARTVHNKTPEDQFNNPLFASFEIPEKNIPEDAVIMDLDALPVYI